MIFKRAVILVSLVASIGSASVADETQVIFDVDYTREGANPTPVVAKGSSAVELLLESAVTPDIDTVAHSGTYGIKVGSGAASVAYETQGNLDPRSGTIELIVRPQNWNEYPEEIGVIWQTMAWGDTPGKLIIYKYKESGIAVFLQITKDETVFLSSRRKSWEPEVPIRITVSYSIPGKIRLFVDGDLIKESTVGAEFSWPERFTVGPISNGFGRGNLNTVITRVTHYSGELNAEEEPNPYQGLIRATPSRWLDEGKPRLALEALDPDTVLPPWEPVAVEGDLLEVWNRTYDLSQGGLVESIISADEELLEAPIDLVLVQKNGDVVRLPFGKPEFTRIAKGRVDFVRHASAAEIQAAVEGYLEYDGMMWLGLSLSGDLQGVEDVRLEIPMNAEHSEFIHYVGAPHRHESQNLPHNSNSFALSTEPGIVFSSGFKTLVWMGNNDAGLIWFTESDQGWWPVDRSDMIQVERETDGSAVLKLNVVKGGYPKNVPAVVNMAFGLMATPVKAPRDGWRDWRVTAQYESLKGDSRGDLLIYWPDQWRLLYLDPDPTRAQNVEKVKAMLERDRSEGRLIIPYWTKIHYPVATGEVYIPEAPELVESWKTAPNRSSAPNRELYRVSAVTGWQDYLVWCFNEWGEVFGHIDGLYLDEVQPIPNTREESQGGYVDWNNVRRPTFEFRGSRDMMKRIAWIAWNRNGVFPVSIAHNSATHTMPYLSTFELQLPGEHLYSAYFNSTPEILPPEDDRLYYYSYVLPMDRLRVEGYWKHWGIPVAWLPMLKNQRDIMENPVTTRDLLSRLQQVDAIVWPLWINRDEIEKTWKFRREFGIGDPEVVFIPNWEEGPLSTEDENVWIGLYRKGDRCLAIVSNLNREPVSLDLDLGKLAPHLVRNAESGEVITLSDKQTIRLDIPRNDYVALAINY